MPASIVNNEHKRYSIGRQIESMSDFANCKSEMYMVFMGKPTAKQRKFLEKWAYNVLEERIKRGQIFTAKVKI